MADKGYTATTPQQREVRETNLAKSTVFVSNILPPGSSSCPSLVIESNEKELTRIAANAVAAALNKAAAL